MFNIKASMNMTHKIKETRLLTKKLREEKKKKKEPLRQQPKTFTERNETRP